MAAAGSWRAVAKQEWGQQQEAEDITTMRRGLPPGSGKPAIKEGLVALKAQAVGITADECWHRFGRQLGNQAAWLQSKIIEEIADDPAVARAPAGTGLGANRDLRPGYHIVRPDGTKVPITAERVPEGTVRPPLGYPTGPLYDQAVRARAS